MNLLTSLVLPKNFLQMRPSFVISLLLLSLFLINGEGIRLEKGPFVDQQHKKHDQENNLLKRINSANNQPIVCEDEKYCTGKIKIRKLVTSSTSTTHHISKNVKNGGNEAQGPEIGNSRNCKVNGEEKEILVNKQQEVSHEHYPDHVNIVDMDYSPPKKNPPVHN
ncbi:uncharacterized protein LOC114915899 [Cajanus cajan]|uniref:uncharacterized protein LOC114915899 n=1 Tax=Cajanus cajan TaxID=3821 RepID=UPI0010FBB464|nr:uncharacterized protein LOC114915899 [Cajanus cajan]